MKSFVVKSGVALILAATLVGSADAQRQPKRRPPANGTTNPQQQQPDVTNNNTTTPAFVPQSNVPFTYDTAAASGISGPSLRNDNLYDNTNLTDRTPLPYDFIRKDDALFAEKVWRELDLREKMNAVFRYDAEEDNGSQLFIDILLKAVRDGKVVAFGDDQFRTPLTALEVSQTTAGGRDTVEKRNILDPSKIDAYVITNKTFDPKSVMKIRVKEQWVFDRESSRMIVRILGIAPVLTKMNENGTERGSSPMFWVYYPELRATLTKYEVYNPKNMGQSRMTWEELFESRMFSSYILKSSMDNPGNKTIRQMMGGGPNKQILALLEGDNIKEKIFNYEQDLWSY
jgi:gliding motility associated protien GldN